MTAAAYNEGDWRERAACRGSDPNLFFPERGDHAGLAAAKAVCNGKPGAPDPCPVRDDCLAWALSLPVLADVGVMGGMSWKQRKRLRESSRAPLRAVL